MTRRGTAFMVALRQRLRMHASAAQLLDHLRQRRPVLEHRELEQLVASQHMVGANVRV